MLRVLLNGLENTKLMLNSMENKLCNQAMTDMNAGFLVDGVRQMPLGFRFFERETTFYYSAKR